MLKKWCALFGACAALTATSAANGRTAAPLDRQKVSAFVDGAVQEALRTDHVAGVAVAIVDRAGVVLTRGYGLAALSPKREADADTLFRVGSISKTGVWISLMQLAQSGEIGLDDPINQHLPQDLQVADQGFNRAIRVRDLMNHSAGFEDSILQGFFIRDPNRLTPLNAFLSGHRLRRVREPGLVSVYSNYGALLAAAIVANVSGEQWDDYVEQHVLRPLGMADATYRAPYSPTLAARYKLPSPMNAASAARLSDSFSYTDGALASKGFEYANGAPVGALSVSAKDMARYMTALLDPTAMQQAGVLSAKATAILRTGLPVEAPQLASWRHGFMDFGPLMGRPVYGHDGDLIYQHATMMLDPDDGVAIFIAVNTPGGLPLLSALPVNLLNTFYGAPPRAPRVGDAKIEAEKVTGDYEVLRKPSFRSERAFMRLLGGGSVSATPDGDILSSGGRYYPVGHGVFANVDGPERIAFAKTDGRMRRYDSVSADPSERVSFLESGRWLALIATAGVFVAAWGGLAFWMKLKRKSDPGRRTGLLLDALCLAWALAFALFFAALTPYLKTPSAAVFDYPGRLLPIALWALALTSVATPPAAILALGPWRPNDWSPWRWARQAASLGVLLALAATLWAWGFLGFSGW